MTCIWGNPVCWVAQPSMEKLRIIFWGAGGSQLNQELSVAYDLMLPQLFTTSVFPLVFKVRFIFAPLVSTRAILSTNPQKKHIPDSSCASPTQNDFSMYVWMRSCFSCCAQSRSNRYGNQSEPIGAKGNRREPKAMKPHVGQ